MNTISPPDQAQRDAAIDPSRSVLVRAPAGSGKTGVLLLRYLNCLLTVEQPEHIVAITFTNKAAGEIKERVIKALSSAGGPSPQSPFDQAIAKAVKLVIKRDEERGWDILKNTSRLRISTFDSFCGSIARRLPLLSGLGSARPLTDTDSMYREAILELFRQLDKPTCPPQLHGALSRLLAYGNNRIETLIPLLSLLMSKRDQWIDDVMSGDIDRMEETLATIVSDAFDEAIPVLQDFNIEALIEAFVISSASCEHHAWAAGFDLSFPFTPEQYPLLAKLAATMISGSNTLYKPSALSHAKFMAKSPGTEEAKSWLKEIHDSGMEIEVGEALLSLSALPPTQIPESLKSLVADFYLALKYLLAYQRIIFDQRGGVDFAEIAQRAIYALSQEGEVTEAVLKEDRIQHILIDEMQDTSVSQIQLIQNLTQDWQPDDGRSVFFCGDLQQSIYAFRGSLVELFDELSSSGEFANRKLQQLQLTANFRSSPDLVNWVNNGFDTLFTQQGKIYIDAEPQRTESGKVVVHPMIQAAGVKAKQQAATYEANQIVDIIKSVQASDATQGKQSSIAILVRSRGHLAKIIPALKKAEIEFSGQDIDTLSKTTAILDFTALLRAMWHEADNIAWARLLRAPIVGLSFEDIRKLRIVGGHLRSAVVGGQHNSLSQEGQEALRKLTSCIEWVESQPKAKDIRWAVNSAWHLLGGPATITTEETKDVNRVLALLDEHAPSGIIEDINSLEHSLARLFATPPTASVEIMTIHKSKGLEFDVVLLPSLGGKGSKDDSPLLVWQRMNGHLLLAPKPQDKDEDSNRLYKYIDVQRKKALADELNRQLYVALTRAKTELHLFGLASINAKGEASAESSSFLGRLWPLVSHEFANAVMFDVSDDQIPNRVPISQRMSNLVVQVDQGYHPPMLKVSPLQIAQRQTENAVIEDNIEQRATGIVFHELMERIGRGGMHIPLLSDVERLEKGVTQRLRHHCHPEIGLEDSTTKVLSMLNNTLACPKGRWILESYSWQASEQTIRKVTEGQWQSLILDRAFIESTEDGDICWIVDYKTSSTSGNFNDFIESQTERYAPKMERYAKALKDAGIECQIRSALYFPAHQHLLILS